ncbi:MAG: DNA polymerase IV [Desulfobacteraceae bacterium]|nr:MAG: DNA polymerase IV [Desulfobacteraceae bacterium]
MVNQLKARAIIHLDMDAFYPAVEVLDNPGLKGKPVIVGGSRERGVVSSSSYEARTFGVHSAQPMATAMRLCPDGVFLPGRMSRYKEVSKQVFQIFFHFTPLVEPLSIDEAFLDVTGCTRLFGEPVEIAKKIKQLVVKETGLTVSAGVAPSKFVAKIASDIDKPDGLTVVTPDQVREFLNPLSIKKMWGVGKVTQEALSRLNVLTFEDLSRLPVGVLERHFGKHGLKMHQLSMGIDERDVVPEHDAKSIGHEQTFSEDIIDLGLAKKELLSLANRVARRLRREQVTGRTITLKVKYRDFVQITRSISLSKPTDDGPEIYSTVCRLLEKTEVGKRPVRLLGISLSQLTVLGTETQLSLFNHDGASQKRRELHTAIDSLHEKFGEKSIRPGTLLKE